MSHRLTRLDAKHSARYSSTADSAGWLPAQSRPSKKRGSTRTSAKPSKLSGIRLSCGVVPRTQSRHTFDNITSLGVWASSRRRRPDDWTSTPGERLGNVSNDDRRTVAVIKNKHATLCVDSQSCGWTLVSCMLRTTDLDSSQCFPRECCHSHHSCSDVASSIPCRSTYCASTSAKS